jgi:hypothetical protein
MVIFMKTGSGLKRRNSNMASPLKVCRCEQCSYILRTKEGDYWMTGLNRKFRRKNKQLLKMGKEPAIKISVPYLG